MAKSNTSQHKTKWLKGKTCYLYHGKNNYYAFSSIKGNGYLLISNDIGLDSGSYLKVKGFTEAKQIAKALEK